MIEARTSCTLSRHSTTGLHPPPTVSLLKNMGSSDLETSREHWAGRRSWGRQSLVPGGSLVAKVGGVDG